MTKSASLLLNRSTPAAGLEEVRIAWHARKVASKEEPLGRQMPDSSPIHGKAAISTTTTARRIAA